MSTYKYWDPVAPLIGSELDGSSFSYAVMVLNRPIRDVSRFLSICSRAKVIVAIDGGANSILDLNLDESSLSICMPKAIVGDLDSIRSDVRAFFEDKGVIVDQDCSKYDHDFTKGMNYIKRATAEVDFMGSRQRLSVVAFGGLGGRADHAFAQLNQLLLASASSSNEVGQLFLITTDSIIFALDKGLNRIHTPVTPGTFTENIGVIPLGRPSTISIKGCEWDVQDWQTEFGSQMSTSNHIRNSEVEVETTERMLFTMEFALKQHP